MRTPSRRGAGKTITDGRWRRETPVDHPKECYGPLSPFSIFSTPIPRGEPQIQHRQPRRQPLDAIDMHDIAPAEDAFEVAVAAGIEADAEDIDPLMRQRQYGAARILGEIAPVGDVHIRGFAVG